MSISILSNPELEKKRGFAPLGDRPRVLMVWPKFPPSFWTFQGMIGIVSEQSAYPPLGLITVAALCPSR